MQVSDSDAARVSSPDPDRGERDARTAEVPSHAAGRGLWIWEFGQNGPDAKRSAALASEWGVSRVFIKSGNGNSRGRWARNFSRDAIQQFRDRGIEVWGFAYFYGEGVADSDGRRWGTIADQVDAVVAATDCPGVAGLVVDAEIEFVGRRDDAARLCALLRARVPHLSVAYTSFGWMQRFPQFPYEEFDRGCGDAFLPQVYFAEGWPGGPAAALDRLWDGVRARGLRAPVWPVQTNMPNPSLRTLQDFFDRAGPHASVFFLHPEGSPQTLALSRLAWPSSDAPR